jgi:hypothetical protein
MPVVIPQETELIAEHVVQGFVCHENLWKTAQLKIMFWVSLT